MRSKHWLASMLLLVGLACTSQIVYLGRDAAGNITTSSQPPADYKPVPFTPLPPQSAQSTTQNQSSARAPSSTAARSGATMAPQGLVLYAADWCPYCRQARQYLKSQGIAYTEINIDTQDGSQAFEAASGNGRRGIHCWSLVKGKFAASIRPLMTRSLVQGSSAWDSAIKNGYFAVEEVIKSLKL